MPTSCESDIHLAFLYLINITVSGDSEEVAILILSGAVERHCDLEELFEICRLSGNHFKRAFLIYF